MHECLFEGDCNDQKIEIINWTDSMTVLCWIANDKLWKQYVMHRVEEIRRLTAKDSWRFCPGTENPADLPSRGVKADDLVSNRLWWDGPEFLHKSEHEWPKHSSEKPDTALAEEVKKQPVETHSLITKGSKPNPLDITKSLECEIFGTLIRLFRVTAYVLRFINNIKKTTKNLKPTKTMKPKGLSASEINAAENIWIRSIQNASFPLEIEYLSGKRHGSIPNRVLQCGLFIDEKGLLRCEGRINKANIPRESKNPILLPSKHPIVDLIVRDVHHQVKHNGIRDTLTTIRERFWLLRGREVVKRILKKCVVCRKVEGAPFGVPPPPDLPPCRVADDPPFTNVGLDFAGPLLVRPDKEVPSSIETPYTIVECLFLSTSLSQVRKSKRSTVVAGIRQRQNLQISVQGNPKIKSCRGSLALPNEQSYNVAIHRGEGPLAGGFLGAFSQEYKDALKEGNWKS